jgi:hypothetical protein
MSERLRAALRLISPDHITPQGKRILEQVIDADEADVSVASMEMEGRLHEAEALADRLAAPLAAISTADEYVGGLHAEYAAGEAALAAHRAARETPAVPNEQWPDARIKLGEEPLWLLDLRAAIEAERGKVRALTEALMWIAKNYPRAGIVAKVNEALAAVDGEP